MSLRVLLAVNEGVGLRSGGVSVTVLTDSSLIRVLSVVAVLGATDAGYPPVSSVIRNINIRSIAQPRPTCRPLI